MGKLSMLATLALGFVVAWVSTPAQAQYYGAAGVRCESHDFRDNYCPADTRGGVRIVRQRSRTPCTEGETWGYDRRGIWVTAGCEGDFELGGGGYGGARGDRGDRGPGYGQSHPNDRYDSSNGGARIVCESRDFRYHHCAAPVRRDVDLVRQHSRIECRYGRSWGFDRHGVWVDRGCAAEFVIY